MADISVNSRRYLSVTLAAALTFSACSPATGEAGAQRPAASAQAAPGMGAGAEAKKASDPAYGTTFPARVLREDPLILSPETRICVETTLDPEAKRIVEASGQSLYPRLVKEITYSTTGRLEQAFRDRGWAHDKPRERLVSHINHELDPQGCFDRPDTIRVWQRIVRGKSPLGYGVRLEAMQGSRAFILAVERPYAVVVAEEIRGALDHRVTDIPGSGPYWDPVRDIAVMADSFIVHLLGRGKTRG